MGLVSETVRIARKSIFEPQVLFRNINSVYHTRLLREGYNRDGVDIFAEDWDNLLILDACRYDMFADAIAMDGTLESRVSRGSNSLEYLVGNVQGRQLHDTVYVTANPHLYRYREDLNAEFHHVVDVWRDEGWDEESHSVLPETVNNAVTTAAEQFPNKRLLVQYMQPHFPFINTTSEFDKRAPDPDSATNMWMEIMTGELDVSRELLWDAYTQNLNYVLQYVEKLVPTLIGKTVITSDHGNMVGERSFPIPIQEWGHPPMTYTDELVTVPWFVIDADSRKTITKEEPVIGVAGNSDDIVEERLRYLGYV